MTDVNYIEWVALVARTFADMRPGASRIVGLGELRIELGLGADAEAAIYTGVKDLDSMSILDMDSIHHLKETDSTRRLRGGASLTDLWPEIFAIFLDAKLYAHVMGDAEKQAIEHLRFAPFRFWTDVEELELLSTEELELLSDPKEPEFIAVEVGADSPPDLDLPSEPHRS